MAEERALNIDLHLIRRKVEALTKRIVQTHILGEYTSIFRGGGLEFDGYKEYTQDIDATKIDWKASIRSKKLLVKTYRDLRELQVYFLIDVSSSMVFGSAEKLKNEIAAEFALALAYIIQSAGDQIGLITFNDSVSKIIEPNKGIHQYYKIANHLLSPEVYGGKFSLGNAADFVVKRIKRKNTIIILISDFYGQPLENWKESMKNMAVKFDTFCIIVRDKRDKELPEDIGLVMVEDPSTGKKVIIESRLLSKRYHEITKKQDETLFN
ncbi:DUF58 domain-containing protein, partial [Candidatus Woesearchaeota archaeon]|nr:DUF58 domain-containing protein [Candidatus Woesearchaeota archaeon]